MNCGDPGPCPCLLAGKTNVAGIYLIDKGLGLAKNHPLCCFVALRFRAHFKLRIIVANNSWTVWYWGCSSSLPPFQIRIYCVSRSLDSFNLGPSCGLSARTCLILFALLSQPRLWPFGHLLTSHACSWPAKITQYAGGVSWLCGGRSGAAAACAWPGISADWNCKWKFIFTVPGSRDQTISHSPSPQC